MNGQVRHYASEFWEYFGVSLLEIWELEVIEFFSIIPVIDKQRHEHDKEERERKRLANKSR